jgi:Family of unknown function (DUF6152)
MNLRILTTAVLVLLGIPASAHHSISAIYDSSRPLTLAGVITGFAFIHPHPFITLEVRDGKPAPEVWRLEMDNRFELEGIGVTATTFKAGDRIVVTGSSGRAQALMLYVRKLERPADGFQYEQAGSSPRISGPSR